MSLLFRGSSSAKFSTQSIMRPSRVAPYLLLPRHAIPRLTARSHPTFTYGTRSQHTQQDIRPRRSFLRSSLRILFYGAVIFVSSVSFGSILAYYRLAPPARAQLAQILKQPPSAAETVSLYKPEDEEAKQINEALSNLPLAVELRNNPSFTESRPALKIPEPIRPTNLTGGTLAGPGRIPVPPIIFTDGGKHSFTFLHLGQQLCGHPGILHGGLLATLLDENLARCCFPALPKKVGVTANLKIDYRKPALAGQNYVIKAETLNITGRKALVRGWIEGVEGDLKGVKVVEAEALFVQPKTLGLLSITQRYT